MLTFEEKIFLIGLNQEQDQKNNVDKAVISGLDPCGIPTTFTQNVINWICTHVTEGRRLRKRFPVENVKYKENSLERRAQHFSYNELTR